MPNELFVRLAANQEGIQFTLLLQPGQVCNNSFSSLISPTENTIELVLLESLFFYSKLPKPGISTSLTLAGECQSL